MVLGFSGVTLLLIRVLLTLKKVGEAFQLHCPLGFLGTMRRGTLADQDTPETEPVAEAVEKPSSEEEIDTVSQSTTKESSEAAGPSEGN